MSYTEEFGVKLTAQIDQFENSMKRAAERIDKLAGQSSRLQTVINKAMLSSSSGIRNLGVSLNNSVTNTRKLADTFNASRTNLHDLVTEYKNIDPASANAAAKMSELRQRIAQAAAETNVLGHSASNSLGSVLVQGARAEVQMSAIGKAAHAVGSALKAAGSFAVNFAGSFLKSMGGAAWNAAKSGASSFLQSVKGLFNPLGALKNASSDMGRSVARHMNSIGSAIKRAFNRAVIQNFIKYTKEGFQALARQSASVNNAMSALVGGMKTFGGQMASALGGVLSAVAPVLNKIIGAATAAANAISQFIAKITGASTYKKAIPVIYDYASSLGGSGGGGGGGSVADAADDAAAATDRATEAAEKYKRTIMGFDQLNVLDAQDESDSSSGSGSGGSGSGGSGGGGGGGAGDTSGIRFVDEAISSEVSEFADLFKEAWENADFTEIGTIVGTKIKDALDNIPWNDIKTTMNKVGTSIATFLNGVLETEGLFDTVGVTVGEALNSALALSNGFVSNFHWDSLGTAISDSINGFFRTFSFSGTADTFTKFTGGILTSITTALDGVDWAQVATKLSELLTGIQWGDLGSKLGQSLNSAFTSLKTFSFNFDWSGVGSSISSSLNNFFSTFDAGNAASSLSSVATGILKTITTAIEKTNWTQIGQKIKDFIVNIDWAGIASGIAETAGAALGAIGATIGGMLADAFTNMGDYFADEIEDCGGNIPLGILKGVSDALGNAATWVYNNVISPIISGFTGALSSDGEGSGDLYAIGEDMINGFFDGIKSVVTNIGNWVQTNIIDPILEKFNNLKTLISDPVGYLSGKYDTPSGAGSTTHTSSSGVEHGGTSGSFGGGTSTTPAGGYATTTTQGGVTTVEYTQKINLEVDAKPTQNYTTLKKDFSNGAGSVWKDEAVASKLLSGGGADGYTEGYKKAEESFKNSGTSVWAANKNAFKTLTGGGTNGYTNGYKNAENSFKNSGTSVWAKNKDARKTLYGSYGDSYKNARTNFQTGGWTNTSARKTLYGSYGDSYNNAKANFNAFRDKSVYVTLGGAIGSSFTTTYSQYNAMTNKTVTVTTLGNATTVEYSADGGVYTSTGKKPITGYAGGGAPQSAQLFMARENGLPELVGRLGSHTAVMNNTQIVNSVASGVRDAVADVMLAFMGNDGGGDIVLYLGDEEVARSAMRGQKALGKRYNPVLQVG